MSTVSEILREIETLPELDRQALLDKLLASAPNGARRFKTWIGKSPVTGLPVLMSDADAPQVTNEEVQALLADFP